MKSGLGQYNLNAVPVPCPLNNMKIEFIKTLEHETNPKNGDVFEYLSDLTMQKIDPPGISGNHIRTGTKVVFHSPLKRVIDTLEFRKDVKYIKTDELSEILFDVKKLCTKKEWQKEKSNIIRRRFKEFFIKDHLPTKRSQIFDEIKNVLNDCLSRPELFNIAVISHSFRLKLIEVFIDTKGEILNNPDLIHKYLFDDKKTYQFGSGFNIERKDLEKIKKQIQIIDIRCR